MTTSFPLPNLAGVSPWERVPIAERMSLAAAMLQLPQVRGIIADAEGDGLLQARDVATHVVHQLVDASCSIGPFGPALVVPWAVEVALARSVVLGLVDRVLIGFAVEIAMIACGAAVVLAPEHVTDIPGAPLLSDLPDDEELLFAGMPEDPVDEELDDLEDLPAWHESPLVQVDITARLVAVHDAVRERLRREGWRQSARRN